MCNEHRAVFLLCSPGKRKMDFFAPKQLLKLVALVMTLCILLWLYCYGRSWTLLSFDSLEESDNQNEVELLLNSSLKVSGTQRIPLERVKLPTGVNSSGIYISVLTLPRNHPTRLAAHLFTWMQTVNPDQVRIITETSDDKIINAAREMGYHVVASGCHDVGNHDALVMCCKSGRQFEEYYRARRAGEHYNWYCHADDDIYVNIVGLTEMLKPYNPKEDVFLGQWHLLGFKKRILHYAPGLLTFPERKRDDFVYPSGNTYCISDPLMMKAEKYLSGQNYVLSCKKAQAVMDDVLVGVVIDGILGCDLIEPKNFRTEWDKYKQFSVHDLKHAATVALGRVVVPKTKFGRNDKTRLLSYHCFIYPDVSWCAMG